MTQGFPGASGIFVGSISLRQIDSGLAEKPFRKVAEMTPRALVGSFLCFEVLIPAI